MAREDRERWDRRYDDGSHPKGDSPDWVAPLEEEIPARGRALDVAAGTGRAALWLARRGLAVMAVDVSPVGLEHCRVAAQREGLAIDTRVLDLEHEPLPAGPFAVVSCFRYLQRDLFPALRERLAPGGVLVCEVLVRRNLERHAHPSARYLLEPNELLSMCAPLEVLYFREGWVGEQAVSRIVARRPGPA